MRIRFEKVPSNRKRGFSKWKYAVIKTHTENVSLMSQYNNSVSINIEADLL